MSQHRRIEVLSMLPQIGVVLVQTYAFDCTYAPRMSFVGRVDPALGLLSRLTSTLLPIVDGICRSLGLPVQSFQVMVAPTSASLQTRRFTVSDLGISAAIFASMIGALVTGCERRLFVWGEVTATGHLVETPKDRACRLDALGHNRSHRVILPRSGRSLWRTILESDSDLVRVEVANIAELISAVYSHHYALLLGALHYDTFCRRVSGPAGLLRDIAVMLTCPDWFVTLRDVFGTAWADTCTIHDSHQFKTSGTDALVGEIVAAYLNFFLRHRYYPNYFAQSFAQGFRDGKLDSPIDETLVLKLAPFVSGAEAWSDYSLLRTLASEAAARTQVGGTIPSVSWTPPASPPLVSQAFDEERREAAEEARAMRIVEYLRETLSERRVATVIYLPIQFALAATPIPTGAVTDQHMLLVAVEQLLARIMQSFTGGAISPLMVRTDAATLLAQTYDDVDLGVSRGIALAMHDAMHPEYGGIAHVLKKVAAKYARDRRAAFVHAHIVNAFSPLDWPFKVRVARKFLTVFAPLLPEYIRSEPAERFAADVNLLIHGLISAQNGARDGLEAIA